MSKHTPEPWFIKREGYSTVYVEARASRGWLQEVAACGPTEKGREEANARRIVACVNACEGLIDYELGRGSVANLVEQKRLLEKQRDELLARIDVVCEVHIISQTYDRIREERQFAADDMEYDLFAAGWKAAIANIR